MTKELFKAGFYAVMALAVLPLIAKGMHAAFGSNPMFVYGWCAAMLFVRLWPGTADLRDKA